MFKWIKKILPFGKKEFSDEEFNAHYELKKEALEKIFGPMDDVVGHALIPFQVGGAVDMYYFSKHLPGTVFATMELINPDGTGPKPNRRGTYELITCTKMKNTMDLKEAYEERRKRSEENKLTPFEKMECRMKGIMTRIGFYSFDAVLQPGETAELPRDDGETNNLIFDEYNTRENPFVINGNQHGLLLIMEIFPSELEYAKENGPSALFEKLKANGVYPYSDMDRQPVI